MSEQVEKKYYSHGNVTVTDKRFISNGHTYAVSGITSVGMYEDKPKRLYPIFLILIAPILLGIGSKGIEKLSLWHFLIIMAPGVIWLIMQKTTYTVRLASASGETRALASKDGVFIRKVVSALNQAIINR